MTMPTVGDISMLDAGAEFYGTGSSGPYNLNGDAGAIGFRASAGIATIGVSQRNGCNNAIPAVGGGDMSLDSLRGASGANMLAASWMTAGGSGLNISAGRGVMTATLNPGPPVLFERAVLQIVFSIPAGETITGLVINSQTTNPGKSSVLALNPAFFSISGNQLTATEVTFGAKRETTPWYTYWDLTINSNSGRSRRFLCTWALDGSPLP